MNYFLFPDAMGFEHCKTCHKNSEVMELQTYRMTSHKLVFLGWGGGKGLKMKTNFMWLLHEVT